MKIEFDCPCGDAIVGENEDDLVTVVTAHLAENHPGRTYTREQILEYAEEY